MFFILIFLPKAISFHIWRLKCICIFLLFTKTMGQNRERFGYVRPLKTHQGACGGWAGLSTILRRFKQASSRTVWFIGKKMLITCLQWFLPIHCYAILQYSGIFPQRVRSHCQGNFWFCFPWQCDSTVTENIPEYCKFHSSDLGKNQCKQGIKFLQLKCHTGLELAHLMRRSIVDSPHRPNLKSKWPRLRAFEDWLVN